MTNPWHTPPAEPTTSRGNSIVPWLTGVVVILAVTAAGTIAWLVFSGPSRSSNLANEPVVVVSETPTTVTTTEPAPEPVPEPVPEPEPETETVTEGASISSYAGMQASTPACNGEVVLIIESVLDDPARLRDVLAANPGSTFYLPGACPSLRARIDGQDIYPVVREYGHDIAGVCAAAASGGGNARILNQDTSFPSPC